MVKQTSILSVLLFLVFFSANTFAAQKTQKPEFTLSLSKQTMWQREQVIVTLRVVTDDLLARLDIKEFTQDGLTIVAFDIEQLEQENKLHLIARWAVFPFVSGDHRLEFPRIRYRPNSGRPIKLELPERTITVKTLPIYVPPTMPVGVVSLESDWNNGWIIPSKKLLEWGIKAQSKQVAPETLPAISRQLRSSDSLTILPIKREIKVEKDKHGILYHQDYHIPVKALSMGRLKLPEVSIQYFEPISATLKKTRIKVPFVVVINQWLLWLMLLISTAVVLYIFWQILRYIRIRYDQFLQKKEALLLIKQSTNYRQLREAIKQYATSQQWDKNITLEQWVNKFKNSDHHLEIKKLIETLQVAEYSSQTSNQNYYSQIATDLSTLLKKRNIS